MPALATYKEEFYRRQEKLFAERERFRLDTLAALVPKLQEIGQRHVISVRRFLVFGSLISPGQFTPDSDIDVAVEWKQKGDYFDLWPEIEGELSCEVDFRELGADSFSERVREHGLVVYEYGGQS